MDDVKHVIQLLLSVIIHPVDVVILRQIVKCVIRSVCAVSLRLIDKCVIHPEDAFSLRQRLSSVSFVLQVQSV